MTSAAVAIKNLSKTYNGVPVFEKLNFAIPAGEAVTLVGPSGCGKSTLLHILAGQDENYQGQVIIAPPEARCSLMLQHYGLFPWKTARANMELPLKLRGQKKTLRNKKLEGLFQELGLDECRNRYPKQLSGGQRQRLALGRALAAEADILFLDEPFSSLDAITRESLQNILANLHSKYKLSYLLTTHSIEEAVFLGAKIMVMGGTPAGIIAEFDNPAFGLQTFRLTDEFFQLVKSVRHSLAGILTERPEP